jgi:plasmid stability protein
MAQLIVRNLEDKVKAQLRQRAARHGRSMEEEVREILRAAANFDEARSGGLAAKSLPCFPAKASDSSSQSAAVVRYGP